MVPLSYKQVNRRFDLRHRTALNNKQFEKCSPSAKLETTLNIDSSRSQPRQEPNDILQKSFSEIKYDQWSSRSPQTNLPSLRFLKSTCGCFPRQSFHEEIVVLLDIVFFRLVWNTTTPTHLSWRLGTHILCCKIGFCLRRPPSFLRSGLDGFHSSSVSCHLRRPASALVLSRVHFHSTSGQTLGILPFLLGSLYIRIFTDGGSFRLWGPAPAPFDFSWTRLNSNCRNFFCVLRDGFGLWWPASAPFNLRWTSFSSTWMITIGLVLSFVLNILRALALYGYRLRFFLGGSAPPPLAFNGFSL